MVSRELGHFSSRELIQELLSRSGAAVIGIRQKTNIHGQKYLLGTSGDPEELSKLMMLVSDYVIEQFEEENGDDEEDPAY